MTLARKQEPNHRPNQPDRHDCSHNDGATRGLSGEDAPEGEDERAVSGQVTKNDAPPPRESWHLYYFYGAQHRPSTRFPVALPVVASAVVARWVDSTATSTAGMRRISNEIPPPSHPSGCPMNRFVPTARRPKLRLAFHDRDSGNSRDQVRLSGEARRE